MESISVEQFITALVVVVTFVLSIFGISAKIDTSKLKKENEEKNKPSA